MFVVPGFAGAHPDLAAGHELVVSSLDARRRSRRVLTEMTWLPPRLQGVDVVHHGGGTVPPRSPQPVLLTLHDVQYRTYPGYLTTLKRAYLRLAVPRSVRHATVVAVPSEYVRTTIVDGFRIEPERVVVVPHGVDVPATVTPDDELRARYGLGDRRYVVYPALTHPHKQHRFLLDLLAGPWSDPDLALVLLGGRGLAEDEVAAAIASLELGPRVIRPGRVPEADRDGLIAGATALVFPSEYEGFGRRCWRPWRSARPSCAATGPPCPRSPAMPRSCGRSPSTCGRVRSTTSTATPWPPPAGRGPPRSRPPRPAPRWRMRTAGASTSSRASASGRAVPEAGPGRALRLVVLGPHFDPDTAPTGRVLSRIVGELAARGHELHVVAALRGTAATPSSPAGPAGCSGGRRRRGARSAGSTRSPAATSATSPAAPPASPASRCSPRGPAPVRVGRCGGPTR